MSDLVGNPEDRFSHNEAYVVGEIMEDGMDYEDSCNGDPGDNPQVDLIHQDNETKENWLVYFAGKTEGSLDDWLERHTPSRINKHRFD